MQHSACAFDLLQDVGSAGRPDEAFGMFVVAIDVTADCQEQFFEIAKYTAPQSVLSTRRAKRAVILGARPGREASRSNPAMPKVKTGYASAILSWA